MPWVPSTDFEEEVVNLQPHHDFIYGALSEPQYSYPRPKSHTDYATKKKLQEKELQKEYETTGNMNEKLRVIQQVQLMAKTKPVGEQPSIHDWDDNKTIEQETIGMMRYCGMGVSVEKPLNEKITISSYPVQNSIQIVKNGRKKVALFFDDNVFKLKEKISDTSSGFESCNNSESNKFGSPNDSIASGLGSETSYNTYSSNSFDSTGDIFSSASSGLKSPSKYLKEQHLPQYEKLLDDISLLSLDSSKAHSNNNTKDSESFKTAKDVSSWTPIFEDEDILSNKQNWPVLSTKKYNCGDNDCNDSDIFSTTQSECTDDVLSNDSKNVKRENFLKRFIKSESTESSLTPPPVPTTYAAVAKVQPLSPKQKQKKSNNSTNFPQFLTTKKMYALKRNSK